MQPDTNIPNPPRGEDAGITKQAAGGARPQGSNGGERTPLPLNETERQLNDDYEWCLHSPDMQRKYGGKVVVVHRRKVLGVGDDHRAALEAALSEASCPLREQLAFVVVPESSLGGRV